MLFSEEQVVENYFSMKQMYFVTLQTDIARIEISPRQEKQSASGNIYCKTMMNKA